MLELALALIIGVILGIVTGLIPGLHPNNVIIIIPLLLAFFDPLEASILLVVMGIINCFINFIPSIFLGAPEDSSVLSVLPGHKLLLQGRGYEAVKLCVIGSLGGVLFATGILPLFALTVPTLYTLLRPNLHFVLAAVVGFMVLKEKGKDKLFALLVFLLSGFLGLIALDFSDKLLFPVLTGLFGLSTLLVSISTKTKLPDKFDLEEEKLPRRQILSSIGIGSLAGILAGLLPGVGAAQSTALAQQISNKDKSERDFLISIGAVTTSDTIYSLLALYLISNPRSGISVAISKLIQMDLHLVFVFLAVIILSAGLGAYLTLKLTKKSLDFLKNIDYQKLCLWTLVFLLILIFIFSGYLGLFVAFVATAIGMIPNYCGCKRTHAMGCLIFPTILWFAGISLI